MIPLFVTALAVAGTIITSSSASADSFPDADSDYTYSVNELEAVAPVEERARKVLGDRFVELWYSDDQRSYVIGVFNLKASEVPALEKAIIHTAPVQFVNRSVSRKAVDRAVALVEAEAARTDYSEIRGWGPDYVAGIVTVDAIAGQVKAVRGKLKSEQQQWHAENRDGVAGTSSDGVAPIVVGTSSLKSQEAANGNPYRAGKYVGVGGKVANCTTTFLVKKSSAYYGMTAGHCGPNGRQVWFGGVRRGNVQNNTLYAAKVANSDAELFHMKANASATLYRSSTINRRVSAQYPLNNVKVNDRVCTRGAKTGAQICGKIFRVNVTNSYPGRPVNHLAMWRCESNCTHGGDSGGPVYKVRADGSVAAVGIHVSGDGRTIGAFIPISYALSGTGSVLVKS